MNLLPLPMANLHLVNLLLESLPYRPFPGKAPIGKFPHRLDSGKLAPGKSDPGETLGSPFYEALRVESMTTFFSPVAAALSLLPIVLTVSWRGY